ncbi:hypothetical protein IQ07DRAFT_508591 [Pyrenochaeta sp. DS3sAY3a]|nr:hypothetical protein IQ07DRAFT_508591 [Pyrenochaeta sp. DS3sAY3a]
MHTAEVDLLRDTASIFIPFIYKFGTNGPPQVKCTIEGVDIEMPVDTGSTCLLVGKPILSNISATAGTPAHHFFTSSRILYVGRLVNLPIHFHGSAGSQASANVPVLIVDKSWRCPWYNPSKDSFTCPPGPDGEKAMERDTSRITYMGVGFGRNQPRDGMPYATPSVNPFLNIHSINNRPLSEKTMRAGYIVSSEGVHLGLNWNNTRGFAFRKLEPGLTHGEDPRDWAMAKMCFGINGEGENCGPVLVDTGIPQMYIRAVEGVTIPTVTIRNPNKRGYARMVHRVKPGTRITVDFLTAAAPSLPYSFVVGEGSVIEPKYVIPSKNAAPPFINTGWHFFAAYSIAFDAVGGHFGIRPTSTASASLL